MVVKRCLACNKKMIFKSPSVTHDYCSRDCANKSRTGEKRAKTKKFKCEMCGREFTLYESQVKQRTKNGGKVRFCSSKCVRKFGGIENGI